MQEKYHFSCEDISGDDSGKETFDMVARQVYRTLTPEQLQRFMEIQEGRGMDTRMLHDILKEKLIDNSPVDNDETAGSEQA